jgi:2,3-bisphosphoglycerate-dependent phosphoglycerate mutase
MPYLILTRHGQSEYNAQGLWTGLTDIGLNAEGIAEAQRAGDALRDIRVDVAFTSTLVRAHQTLDAILQRIGQTQVRVIKDAALNERDYGDLTGKNKWTVRDEYGEEQFLLWRRSWDYPIPNGESLKDVYARVVPYYQEAILPELRAGHNVLIVAHGNSLRALIKYLEDISNEDIPSLELGTAEVYLYETDAQGAIRAKEIRAVNPNAV